MIKFFSDLFLGVIVNWVTNFFSPQKDSHNIVISGNKKTTISDSIITGSVAVKGNKDVEITEVELSGDSK